MELSKFNDQAADINFADYPVCRVARIAQTSDGAATGAALGQFPYAVKLRASGGSAIAWRKIADTIRSRNAYP